MTFNNQKEDKRARFQRVASRRTNNVLTTLRVLGNCSNKTVYKYSEDDVRKIFSEIERVIRETRAKYQISNPKEFKL